MTVFLPPIDQAFGRDTTPDVPPLAFETQERSSAAKPHLAEDRRRRTQCCTGSMSGGSRLPDLNPANWASRIACWWLRIDYNAWKSIQGSKQVSVYNFIQIGATTYAAGLQGCIFLTQFSACEHQSSKEEREAAWMVGSPLRSPIKSVRAGDTQSSFIGEATPLAHFPSNAGLTFPGLEQVDKPRLLIFIGEKFLIMEGKRAVDVVNLLPGCVGLKTWFL